MDIEETLQDFKEMLEFDLKIAKNGKTTRLETYIKGIIEEFESMEKNIKRKLKK